MASPVYHVCLVYHVLFSLTCTEIASLLEA